MSSMLTPVLYGTLLCLVQILAALPWLATLELIPTTDWLKKAP